jgi:serine/threonine protein kinase
LTGGIRLSSIVPSLRREPQRPGDLPETPDRIEPYLIIEPLTSGGSGVVYRARHHSTGEEAAQERADRPPGDAAVDPS